MTTHTSPHLQHYFVPQPSPYPFILSGGMFTLALGFILSMNAFAAGSWIMLAGAAVIVFVVYNWFGKVIGENQSGSYSEWEDKSFRYGMIWFIASEVAFFAAFFGALFYVRNISVPALAGMDPAFTLWKDLAGELPEFQSTFEGSGRLARQVLVASFEKNGARGRWVKAYDVNGDARTIVDTVTFTRD